MNMGLAAFLGRESRLRCPLAPSFCADGWARLPGHLPCVSTLGGSRASGQGRYSCLHWAERPGLGALDPEPDRCQRDVDCSTLRGPHSCSTARDGLPCLQPSLPDPSGRPTDLGKRCPHTAMLGCPPGSGFALRAGWRAVEAPSFDSPGHSCSPLCRPPRRLRTARWPGPGLRCGRGEAGCCGRGSHPQRFWADLAPGGPGRPPPASEDLCGRDEHPSPWAESHGHRASRAILVLRIPPCRGGFLRDISRHGTDLRQIPHLISVTDVGADARDKNQAVLDPRAVAAPGLRAACPLPPAWPAPPGMGSVRSSGSVQTSLRGLEHPVCLIDVDSLCSK